MIQARSPGGPGGLLQRLALVLGLVLALVALGIAALRIGRARGWGLRRSLSRGRDPCLQGCSLGLLGSLPLLGVLALALAGRIPIRSRRDPGIVVSDNGLAFAGDNGLALRMALVL